MNKQNKSVHSGGWVDVRDPHNGLLFRYDPTRQVVEIRKKKVLYLVDLTRFRPVDIGE